MTNTEFNPADFEGKWMEKWLKDKIYASGNLDSENKKFYSLYSFPYPSGDGLHVGHVLGMVANDIVARYYRMKGHITTLPMGWDGFGLPAENFAIKTGVKPSIKTEQSVANFIEQINRVGIGVDWERELGTHRANYYKWTQWIFLQLYKEGLAYKKFAPVNWCPKDQTVLANEQVIDGKCERCDTLVEQKEMSQWFYKITEYANRLDKDLNRVDWPEGTKQQQRNWIGKSEGTRVKFKIVDSSNPSSLPENYIEVFTTRLDTIFGCTFLVVSPENQIIESNKSAIKNLSEVLEYVKSVKNKTDLERQIQKEKAGVELIGVKAINPFNNDQLPIFVADYVLNSYGTGAVMAVPAHDERDNEFAEKYSLPSLPVITMEFGEQKPDEQPVDGVSLVIFDPNTQKYGFVKHKSGFLGLVAGGKKDNESYYDTAKRELAEETGLWDYSSIHLLGEPVFAHYWHSGKKINRFAKIAGVLIVLNSTDVKESALEEHEKDFVVEWSSPRDIFDSYNNDGTKHLREILKRGINLAITLDLDKENKIENYPVKIFTESGILINSSSKPARYNSIDAVIFARNINLEKLDDVIKKYPVNLNRYGYYSGVELYRLGDTISVIFFDSKQKDEILATYADAFGGLENLVEYSFKKELFKYRLDFTKEPLAVTTLSKEETEIINSLEREAEMDFSGVNSREAIEKMQKWLEEKDLGKKEVLFRLRDWLVSRQRYWGAPIPIVYDPNGNAHPLKEEDLPLLLPEDADFNPSGESPIARSEEFKKRAEDKYGKGWRYEVDTMDTFVDSSWYFLRYLEAQNETEIFKIPTKLPKVTDTRRNSLIYNELESIIYAFSKENVDYALFGSVAIALLNRGDHKEHKDIDIFVSTSDIEKSKELLEQIGFSFFNEEQNEYATLTNNRKGKIIAFKKDSVKVELIEVEWEKEIWKNRVLVPLNGNFTYVAPLKSLSDHYQKSNIVELVNFLENIKTPVNLWLPVDLYIIGTEHIVLHLLYARFFTKFFFDMGYINFDEPFAKMRHMGLILGPDGRKMSKRWGNVINPTDEVNTFGADTLRMYEMFMGPFDEAKPWNNRAENGVFRFLKKVWALLAKVKKEISIDEKTEQETLINKLIKKVSEDIESLSFNTTVAKFMESVNKFGEYEEISQNVFEIFLKLLAPFAPFITEELWGNLGNNYSIHKAKWPEFDKNLVQDDKVKIAVQINGKVRDVIEVAINMEENKVLAIAKEQKMISKYITGEIKKIIYIKGKILNIIV